jgi:hypothetical protein
MNPETGQLQNLSKINFNLSVVKGPDVKVRAFFYESSPLVPLQEGGGRNVHFAFNKILQFYFFSGIASATLAFEVQRK